MEMPHSIMEVGVLLCECQMVVRTLGCPRNHFVKYACCWVSVDVVDEKTPAHAT